MSIDVSIFKKVGEQYGCIWIGVIDTVDKKHGTKDLISLKGKQITCSLEIGKLVACIPMCPLGEFLLVNLTSASRNGYSPCICSHLNPPSTTLIYSSLTVMILYATWFLGLSD